MDIPKKNLQNACVEAMLDMKADNVELMTHLRDLLRQRDELVTQLEAINHECEIYKEVFSCKTEQDAQHLIEEFLPEKQCIPPILTEEKDTLVECINLLKIHQTHKHFGIGICRLDVNTIIIEFVPPSNYTPPDLSLIKLEQNENTFRLIHSLFPAKIIPVDELEKKYLGNEDKQDVAAFIHSLRQYVFCFWKRDIEVQAIKKADYMKDSNIYHNRNRTVVSFTQHFLNKYIVEIKLLFDPLSYIAYSASHLVQDDAEIPKELEDALEELENSLQAHLFSLVVRINFGSEDENSKQGETAASEAGSASTGFEMFK